MGTKEFNFSGFTRVNIRFAMELEIVRSDAFSVVVSGSDILTENIDVSVEGDRLTIGYKLNLVSFFAAPFTRAHARITLPELRELSVTGAAHGTVQGFTQPSDFSLLVTGASNINLREIEVGGMRWDLSGASQISGQTKVNGNAEFRITGASRVDLRGQAQDIAIDANGASHLELKDFTVHNMRARLSGASRSTIQLDGKLDVDLSGASSLEYVGQPTMGEIRVTGASTFKKR